MNEVELAKLLSRPRRTVFLLFLCFPLLFSESCNLLTYYNPDAVQQKQCTYTLKNPFARYNCFNPLSSNKVIGFNVRLNVWDLTGGKRQLLDAESSYSPYNNGYGDIVISSWGAQDASHAVEVEVIAAGFQCSTVAEEYDCTQSQYSNIGIKAAYPVFYTDVLFTGGKLNYTLYEYCLAENVKGSCGCVDTFF